MKVENSKGSSEKEERHARGYRYIPRSYSLAKRRLRVVGDGLPLFVRARK